MLFVKEKFIVDGKGRKKSVILDIKDYEMLCEEREELDAIRAYDQAKSSDDEVIPFEQAVKEIEKKRR
jgi:hypothetical protein